MVGTHRRWSARRLVAGLLAGGLLVTACSSDDDAEAVPEVAESTSTTTPIATEAPTSTGPPPTAAPVTDAASAATTAPTTTPPATSPAITTEPAMPTRFSADGEFEIYTVDGDADGPSGAKPVDLDDDGDLDLVVTHFGDRGPNPGPVEFPPGGIFILWNEGEGLASWTRENVIVPDENVYFPNKAQPLDLDDDGDLDLLVAAGFFVCEFNLDLGPCGALFWMENDGGSWTRHDIIEPDNAAFYHRAELVDIDLDGIDDLVTVGEFQADAVAEWYRGTGGDPLFEPIAQMIGRGGGSLPVVHDVDGDGDADLASGEFFLEGTSFVWFEQVEPPSDASPAGVWERHDITSDLGRTIQLSVIPDLYGDGADGWIGSNHVNTVTGDPEPLAGIYELIPRGDPREPWSYEIISDGIESLPTVGTAFQAAPGVFSWGDVDGDGDIDLTASGDGDPRVFWFEQTPDGWVQHVLAEDFGQAASGEVADLDGDGDNEIIFTSYETNEVVIFTPTPNA